MSVSAREVFATAKIVIQQHGPSAAYFAAGRADEFLDIGDLAGAAVWRPVWAPDIQGIQGASGGF